MGAHNILSFSLKINEPKVPADIVTSHEVKLFLRRQEQSGGLEARKQNEKEYILL